MLTKIVIVLFLLISSTFAVVTFKHSGLSVEVSNDLVKFNFKSDATISSLHVLEENIVSGASRSFYLDWTGSNGEIRLHPSSIFVVEETDERAHFFWVQNSNITADALNIELHYILEDGLSGIYSYAKYTNDKSEEVSFGETRMIYRFNPSSLLTIGTSQVLTEVLPTENEIDHSKTVQDATYEFSNGTYFTKYDYAVYVRETQYQGVYGGGYGAFVISPSREYHGGGAMKQDLTVHTYSLVTNYFMSAHFGNPALKAPPGWSHIYGPFLIYLPTGDSDDEIVQKVQEQVKVELARWPYVFVSDVEYPLQRGSLKGKVTGQSSATISLYDSVSEGYLVQQLGYLFTANTDSDGNYEINNIRPGSYKVVAYPIAGQGSEVLVEKDVTIEALATQEVDFELPEPINILWSIGEVNRRSSEFHFSDEMRNYKWKAEPPTTLNFTIGISDVKTDWYYAQANPGSWYVYYQDSKDGNSRSLRLPIAGASASSLVVKINGEVIETLTLENDASIYRSAMQSGKYRSYVLNIDADIVVDGENVLELNVVSGAVMYDALSLQVNK